MQKQSIVTVSELRKAIKTAKEIYIQARFGVSETWIKISKKEATFLTAKLEEGQTPNSHEMGTGQFAELSGSILYIG